MRRHDSSGPEGHGTDEREAEVAVVGAGLSGLTAARELRRRGRSVVVLEARDRVGGLMDTVEVDGCAIDLGAHWVGPTQTRVRALAGEFGVGIEPQFQDGRHHLLVGGRRKAFTGSVPRLSPAALAEAGLALARLEVRRRLVGAEEPWRARGASRLDAVTVAHWMRTLRSAPARMLITVTCRTAFGAEPSEMSLLYFLSYLQAAGGLRAIADFEGGAQDSHLRGGTQQLCRRVAEELGDAVVLEAPVSAIRCGAGEAVVESARGAVRARHVVLALAPPMAARIRVDPPLPVPRVALAQRTPMGSYMKGVALFDRPWWRDQGLSGIAFADEGPVQMVVDASPGPEGPGVLVAYVCGAWARTLGALARDVRRAPVLEAMATLIDPRAARPARYLDRNWHEERWSQGGPIALMGPGVLTTLGPALTDPVGPVHFAGTDTATRWRGYMEGAMQAGERVAAELP